MTSAELKYLLAIDELYDGKTGIKLTEIAAKMNVTKVSVYRAAERLEKNGYIRRDEKNKVVINDFGYEQLEKYNFLIKWICSHLVDKGGIAMEVAYSEAIGVACEFSDESRKIISELIETLEKRGEKAHD